MTNATITEIVRYENECKKRKNREGFFKSDRRDSNPHFTGLKPVVSANWTTEAFVHPEGFEPSTPRA